MKVTLGWNWSSDESYLVMKVRIVKEVKRSDGLWRFACGDVCIWNWVMLFLAASLAPLILATALIAILFTARTMELLHKKKHCTRHCTCLHCKHCICKLDIWIEINSWSLKFGWFGRWYFAGLTDVLHLVSLKIRLVPYIDLNCPSAIQIQVSNFGYLNIVVYFRLFVFKGTRLVGLSWQTSYT